MNRKVMDNSSAKQRGGALLKLLAFLVIFTGVLAVAWIYFLPAVLTSTLQKRTGFPVKVAALSFNPFKAKADLTGFVISNPDGFPRPEFLDISLFEANARMKTIFSNRPEFDYARVEVACVTLVRTADGVLNAQLFHDRMYPPPPPPPEEIATKEQEKQEAKIPAAKVIKDGVEITIRNPPKPTAKEKEAAVRPGDARAEAKDGKKKEKKAETPKKYMIGRLEVRFAKIVVVDYTVTPVSVREFNVKLNYVYNNFTDPSQLMAPFAFKSLESVGAAIRGLIPGEIGRTMDAATKGPDPLYKPDEKKPGEDTLKTVVEKLEESQKP